MENPSSAATRRQPSERMPRSSPSTAPCRSEDFPGCESFHLPAREIDLHEGRIEFWDGRTETAWRVRDVSIQHDGPSRRLVEMATRVATLRGSRIACFGSSGLVRLDEKGRKRWLMQADEVLYLHPARAKFFGTTINVDEDPLPDVVLEVDHTTDVRRRKLGIYMECGFPEIWVLVPWVSSRREQALTIHLRGEDGYREAPESAAFPGWRAEGIQLALTEDPLSAKTWRALERVALAMGAREGTGPENDPLIRSVNRTAEARGDARGYARGRAEGHVEGCLEAVATALRARGIGFTRTLTEYRELFARHPIELLVTAALECTDEADFRQRLRAAPD